MLVPELAVPAFDVEFIASISRDQKLIPLVVTSALPGVQRHLCLALKTAYTGLCDNGFKTDPRSWRPLHPRSRSSESSTMATLNPTLTRCRIFQPRSVSSDSMPVLHTHDAQFRKLLTPGKIGQIICLGNLKDKETYDYLRQVAPELHIVKGDYDVDTPNMALSKVVQHGNMRLGFTHGHTIIPQGDADALLIAARQMDVDVLLWGGTHKFEAYELEGKFFVNPGSATGAFSTNWGATDEEPIPSFCLMDVSRCVRLGDAVSRSLGTG